MRIDTKNQPAVLVLVFAAVCVMSAMALVCTKHESRKLFVELEALTSERDELNIESKSVLKLVAMARKKGLIS